MTNEETINQPVALISFSTIPSMAFRRHWEEIRLLGKLHSRFVLRRIPTRLPYLHSVSTAKKCYILGNKSFYDLIANIAIALF